MKRKHLIWALPFVLGASCLSKPVTAQEQNTDSAVVANNTLQGVVFPFSLLDAALNNRVNKEGGVNYAVLKGDKNLEAFVQAVATADISQFPVFKAPVAEVNPNAGKKDKAELPKEDRSWELLFWINAYNAHVVKTIADAYPINTVADIKDFDTAKTHVVAGNNYSFEEMRKKIVSLDPRALFALTDGTKSGPALSPQAYRWTGLGELLNANAGAFISNANNVQLTRIQNKVAVNEFLASVDEAFKPAASRRKWDGIRFLLVAYTQQRADRSYFTTNDYQVLFTPRSYDLNNWTNSEVLGNTGS
jgi:hypothetical protein